MVTMRQTASNNNNLLISCLLDLNLNSDQIHMNNNIMRQADQNMQH